MTGQGRAITVRRMRTTAPAIAARALRERARGQYLLDGRTTLVPPLTGGLYLVATPIGNLRDITVRALEVLAAVDLIACEDTRVTRKLLDRYGIATPLTSYHEHNAAQARPKLLARLADGAAIALVSDAGTPLVSDPGYKLVREAEAAGANLTAVPGASAVLAALTVSGLPTDRFLFEGFLPAKEAARRARIAELERIPATLVLFESGARVAASLADLAAGLGPREAARSADPSAASRGSDRVSDRHFSRKPSGGVSHRQGLSHPGAALEEPGRRNRYHRATPKLVDICRGQSARATGRCGLVGHRSPAFAHCRRCRGLARAISR